MRLRSEPCIVCALVAATITLAACSGPTTQSQSDGPLYDSVADLAAEADLVVRGLVGALRGTEVDDGGNSGGGGIPLAFYDFDIGTVIAGSAPNNTIAIAWLDLAKTDDGRSALESGDELVLFLDHRTSASAPGIESESDFYVALGADSAVFDVEGANVIARSASVIALKDGAAVSGGGEPTPLIAPLATFSAVVEEHSA